MGKMRPPSRSLDEVGSPASTTIQSAPTVCAVTVSAQALRVSSPAPLIRRAPLEWRSLSEPDLRAAGARWLRAGLCEPVHGTARWQSYRRSASDIPGLVVSSSLFRRLKFPVSWSQIPCLIMKKGPVAKSNREMRSAGQPAACQKREGAGRRTATAFAGLSPSHP